MTLSFKFDPSKLGLRKVFNEYQELALHYLWEVGGDGVGSRKVWETVLERLTERKKVSRASIIMFLEKLRKQGVLRHIEETSPGGHRKIYFPLMDEDEFVKHIAITMINSMLKDFPEVSEEFLESYRASGVADSQMIVKKA